MRIAGNVLLLCVLLFVFTPAEAQIPALKDLYQQHRFPELRRQLKVRKGASPLYVGAVASAWNNSKEAEKFLKQAIAKATDSEDAAEAHEQLGYLYARSGKYRAVVRELDSILRINPGRADVENIRVIYSALAEHGNQSVKGYRRATIDAEVSSRGVVLPVSVHGREVHWLLDTDFNICAISESEAKLLGVVSTQASAEAGDSETGTVKVRTAVVNELLIGPVRLRNVAFMIVPDSQPPMNELPPGHQGLIGFPVAWALRAIGWTRDGKFEIGFSPDRQSPSQSNLFFDGLSAITRVGFRDKELDFILDTGNLAGTELWQRFADDFPSLVKRQGAVKKEILTEIGGSVERQATVLPEVQLQVGGLETTLRPAAIFAKPVGDDFHHGLLGMDLLSQAQEVRIDFRSMTLQLKP
jgi:predicted aspartyl protease